MRRTFARRPAQAGEAVGVDLVAAHLPRTDDWAAATGARVRALRAVLDKAGRSVPIYLNEERRADDGKPLGAASYARAVTEARSAGAAGWVFHTTAGFELTKTAFLDAISADERAGCKVATAVKPAKPAMSG